MTQGISAFWLKIIAITGMVMQHTALALPGIFPLGVEIALQLAGGFTFPIMAFLLVEGFRHTSNLRHYKQRLLIFGFISVVPHMLVFGSGLNIMFGLLFGLILLELHSKGNRRRFWLAFVIIMLASIFFDWGFAAPLTVLMYDIIKGERLRRVLCPLIAIVASNVSGMLALTVLGPFIDLEALAANQTIAAYFFYVGVLLTIPLMLMYKGERGRPMKWFFYGFYPAHFIVLAVVSMLLGINVFIDVLNELIAEFSQIVW